MEKHAFLPYFIIVLLSLALFGCAAGTPASSGWMTQDKAVSANPALPPNMYPRDDYSQSSYYRPGSSQIPARVH